MMGLERGGGTGGNPGLYVCVDWFTGPSGGAEVCGGDGNRLFGRKSDGGLCMQKGDDSLFRVRLEVF